MRIIVEVKPGSIKEKVILIEDNKYRVEVKAKPEKGKANKAILKLLKKYFGKEVVMIGGYTSNIKLLELNEE